MKLAATLFFIFGAILLLGAIKYFFRLTSPGVYPPKQILKKRTFALAGGGGICLVIAVMITYFL
jgi:hypothetical protein